MNKHFRLPSSVRTKLREAGVAPADVLRQAGLPLDLFEQDRILLTTPEFFAFWRAVEDVSRDPAFGLELGSERRFEHLAPLSIAAIATENLQAAMEQIAQYKRLSCPEDVVAEVAGDELRVRFRWLLAEQPEPNVLADFCFAWIVTIARLGTGKRIVPLRVELARPGPAPTVRARFDAPVITDAEHNMLVFRLADAQMPFVTRNADLLGMLAPQFEAELATAGREGRFSDRVRDAIQSRLAGRRPSIEDVAEALHVSPRTLQRRLREDGSSFQGVLEDARRRLARHYLTDSLLELGEAAYLLGYEDANSFVRAFRNWEGTPPAHWRDRMLAGAERTAERSA